MADIDGQAGLWLYVKPSLGLPHFLGGIALTAIAIHLAVVGHTTWFNKFLNGEKIKASISYVMPSNHA
jgi:light-harvesting protein B-800-850 alpha chain